jgi:hypothetical protein
MGDTDMNTRMRMVAAVIAGAAVLGTGGAAVAAASTGSATAATHVPAVATSAASLTWHPLHLLNGWTAWSPGAYGTPSYAVQNGVLYLRGIVRGPSLRWTFAQLPAGARPSHFLWLNAFNMNSSSTVRTPCTMEITPSGFMAVTGGASVTIASLAAIEFPLSS